MSFLTSSSARSKPLARRLAVPAITVLTVAMIAGALTLATSAPGVQAQNADTTCYGINDGDGTMVSYVANTVTSLGATGFIAIESLGANQDRNELTAYDANTNQLVTFAPGSATSTGTVGFQGTGDIDGLTWVNHTNGNPADDQLWGTYRNGLNTNPDGSVGTNVADQILRIDPATGAVLSGPTDIVDPGAGGANELDDNDGLIWDSTTGTIYGVIGGDTTANVLITINPTTGAITQIPLTLNGGPILDVESLDAGTDGQLYGSTGEDGPNANNFLAINETTGAVTVLTSLTAIGVDFEATACLTAQTVTFEPATCYTIDEGNGADDNHLVRIDISAAGVPTFTDLGVVNNGATPPVAARLIESLAYRNGFTPQALYTFDPQTNSLIRIDIADGTNVTRIATPALGDIDGLTWRLDNDTDPANDELWGVVRLAGTTNPEDQLIRIDPNTGAVLAGPITIQTNGTGAQNDVDGLAWDPITDQLFAPVNGSTTANNLITIDRFTGAVTIIGNTGVQDIEDNGFTDAGQLYGTTGDDGTTPNSLVRIDKATGVSEVLTPPIPLYGDYESFDCAGVAPVNPPDVQIRTTVVRAADPCPATYAAAIEGLDPRLPVAPGTAVKYCVNVINNGTGPAQNVQVENPNAPGTFLSVPTTLAPGAEGNASFNYTVVDAGSTQQFTASVTASDTNGNALPPDTDPAGTTLVLSADIEIRTTVVRATDPCPATYAAAIEGLDPRLQVAPGTAVKYCVNVINNGPGTAFNVEVEDPTNPGTFLTIPGTLAPGAEGADDFPFTVVNSGSTQQFTATVTGEDGLGNPVTPDSDPAGTSLVNAPDLQIRTTVVRATDPCPATYAAAIEGLDPRLEVAPGTAVKYCVNVINNGPGTAFNVEVEDPTNPGTFLTIPGTLAPGAEGADDFPFTVVNAGSTQQFTATVTGEDGLGTPVPDDSDPAGTALIEPPALQIRTTVVRATDPCPATYAAAIEGLDPRLQVAPGTTVKYCVNVINNGPGTAFNVEVEDPTNPGTFLTIPATLAPGAEGADDFPFTVVNAGSTQQFTATVTGEDGLGTPVPDDSDPAGTALIEPPSLQIRTTVVRATDPCPATYAAAVEGLDRIQVAAGTQVKYCVNVINNGPGTAFNVEVEDPTNPGTFLTIPATLAPGAEGADDFLFTVVDAGSTQQFTATVTGEDGLGTPVPDDSDPAGTTLVLPPSLDIVTTVVGAADPCPATFAAGAQGLDIRQVAPGTQVKYCVNVINNGPGAAQNVEVQNPSNPAELLTNISSSLAPNAQTADSFLFTVVDAVSTDRFIAVVNGEDLLGTALPPQQDPAGTDLVLPPDLQIRTTVVPAGATCPATYAAAIEGLNPRLQVAPGTAVKYCVNVINNGTGPAQNVQVENPNAPGTFLDIPTTLAPGAEGADDFPFTVVDAGSTQQFTATVTGEDGLGTPVPDDSDPAGTTVVPPPSLDIVTTVVGATDPCPATFAAGAQGLDIRDVAPGTQVKYCVNVINNGPGSAQNVEVQDPSDPTQLLTIPASLAPAGEGADSFLFTVVNASSTSQFTAVVNGEDLLGTALPPQDDPAGTRLILPPSLDIVTTVVGATDPCPATFAAGAQGLDIREVAPGTQVKYCVNVINNGPGSAQNVEVQDPSDPTQLLTIPASLAPAGEGADSFLFTVVDASSTSQFTAVVNGEDLLGTALPPQDDPAGTRLILPPVLEIVTTVVRAADPCPATFAAGTQGLDRIQIAPGTAVKYCVTVINNGPGTAENVRVPDPLNVGQFLTIPTTLTPGQQASTSFPFTVVDDTSADQFNLTVTGQDELGTAVPSDSDPAGTTLIEPPVLEIVTTVVRAADPCPTTFAAGTQGLDRIQVAPGTAVKYCVTVINNGPGTAENVRVADPRDPTQSLTIPTTLIAGQQASTSFPFTVVNAASIDEFTAVVTGDDLLGTPIPPDSDPAGTTLVEPPALQIVTTVVLAAEACPATFAAGAQGLDRIQVAPGTAVKYCVTVINNGPGAAQNVQVPDPLNAGQFLTIPTTLTPGQQASTSFPFTVVDDTSTDEFNLTVTGEDLLGAPVPSDSDPAGTTLIEPPALDIVTTVVRAADPCPATFAAGAQGLDRIQVAPGTAVKYCVTVINNGPGGAQNVRVADPHDPTQSLTIPTTLAAGAQASTSFPFTVVNVASTDEFTAVVTGEDLLGVALPPQDDPAGTTLVEPPALQIVTTVVLAAEACPATFAAGAQGLDRIQVAPGTAVKYCVTVINNGPGAAQNVQVPDPLNAGQFLTIPTTLTPGQQASTSFPFTVVDDTSTDEFNLTVTGEDLLGAPVPSDSDPAGTTLIEPPALDIVTTVVRAADPCPATFAAGAQGLDRIQVAPGTAVKYCVTVINNGPGGAQNVRVADPRDPTQSLTIPTTLAAGAQASTSFPFTVVNAASTDEFTAVVTGEDLLGVALPPQDDPAGTTLVEPPALQIVTTVVLAAEACPATFAAGAQGLDRIQVAPGTAVKYCVTVINNGPGAAQNVQVPDPFNAVSS